MTKKEKIMSIINEIKNSSVEEIGSIALNDYFYLWYENTGNGDFCIEIHQKHSSFDTYIDTLFFPNIVKELEPYLDGGIYYKTMTALLKNKRFRDGWFGSDKKWLQLQF